MRHNRYVLPDRAAQWVTEVIGSGSRVTSARRRADFENYAQTALARRQ